MGVLHYLLHRPTKRAYELGKHLPAYLLIGVKDEDDLALTIADILEGSWQGPQGATAITEGQQLARDIVNSLGSATDLDSFNDMHDVDDSDLQDFVLAGTRYTDKSEVGCRAFLTTEDRRQGRTYRERITTKNERP